MRLFQGAMTKSSAPLEGLRVLDFTRVLAGPYLTMVLADLGAEVIKIENPSGGDDTRAYRPPEIGGESFYFLAVNRGKRSVALDFSRPEGLAVARDLARHADILVQNFRADVMERRGLDHATLSADNPGLIYASITGYGFDSPYRLVAGYDQIAQGEGGLQYLTGEADRPPVRAGASIADTVTGLHCGMAILAAVRARDVTGRGQAVDLALLDSVMAVTSFMAQWALLTGEDPPRRGNESALVVPTGLFECEDGPMNLLCGNDKQFQRLCREVVDRPDWADDERLRTIRGRQIHGAEIVEGLARIFATRPRDHWIARMRRAGVPAGGVRAPTEATAAPEPRARGLIRTMHHPTAGAVETVGSPIRLSETPVREVEPSPLLGEHTDAVLSDLLGYGADRIDDLRRRGIIA